MPTTTDFRGLVTTLKTVSFSEKRFDSEHYFEIVVKLADLKKLTSLVETFFGAPFKSAGKNLKDKESQEFIENYGGIRRDQTLYLVQTEKFVYYAMLWPWSDGNHVTLKMEECERKL